MPMLDRMNFSRAWSNRGRRIFGNVPQLAMCVSIDSERLSNKTAPAEFYRSARFAPIMPSRRRGVARIFAYDRGTAPQVTPACLIRCHDFAHGQPVEKFMGLREPFTILRNVRDTTSPAAPSVDLVRFRVGAQLASNRTRLVPRTIKNKSASQDFCEAPHLREIRRGGIIVLEPTESPMMHKLRHALTAEDRRVVRNWAWGVLIVYSACALTIFGLASLSQHSADASKEPAAAAVTATADRSQRTR
jgi:hypothetical protein